MLEQDKNTEVSTIKIQQKLSSETDTLRFTPSKRIFFQDTYLKAGIHKEKDVSCLKSNSKILKKKRHKDKFKLFKLDRHLLDPIQCHLGKSGKYCKKKDKLAANNQTNGSRIPVTEKTSWAGKTNQIWLFPQPKPLEYTFDILSLTATNSHPPIVEEQEDNVNKPLGNDFFIKSSYSPLPRAAVTDKLLMGDLIDLGTPNKSDHKAQHESDFKPQLSSLNPLLIIPKETSLETSDAAIQSAISEVRSLESGELKEQPASSTSLIMLDRTDSAPQKSHLMGDYRGQKQNLGISNRPNNSDSVHDRARSPMVFYAFPCLKSPADQFEKQQMSTNTQMGSAHSCQMLVDRLRKDPFPKIVRENAKVHVRRRAFSMDDTLMTCLPCRPEDKMIAPKSPSEVEKVEDISNGEGSLTMEELRKGSLTMGSSTSQKSNEPVEGKPFTSHTTLKSEVVLGNVCESLKDSILEFYSDNEMNGDEGHSNPPATENNSTSEDSSGIPPPEISYATISRKDPNSNILAKSVELSSTVMEGENVANEIGGSEKVNEIEPTPDMTSDEKLTQQTEDQTSPVKDNLTSMKKLCDTPEENQCSILSTNNEEPSSRRTSIVQQQVSSAQDIKTDFVNTTLSPNVYHEISKNTLEMGPLSNSKEEGSGLGNTSSQRTLDQTLIPFPSGKDTELSGDIAVNASEFHLTNSRKSNTVENNIYVMNEVACSTSKLDLPVSQDASVTVGTALSSPEQSMNKSEENNLDGDLEQCPDYTLVNTFEREIDQNTGGKKNDENIAVLITTPIKEIATPTNVTCEHSNINSSFGDESCMTPLNHWVLPPGKKFRRSLSIIRNLDEDPSAYSRRGRHYEQSVEEIIRLQGNNVTCSRTPVHSICKRFSKTRLSWMRQITPPRVRRSTFTWSPTIPDRGTLYETPRSRKSIYSTPMQQNLVNRMSIKSSPMTGRRRSVHSPVKQDCAPASPVQYTFRDLILTICKQTEPCSFSDILSEESYEGGCKIGEGVFGEVFSITRENENTVMKIIPVEGQLLVNGEKQKTYQEVFSELVIAKELDELRYEGSDELNLTCSYAEIIATSLVQDSYPEPLLRFWEEFDQTKGSDNENPKLFDKEQLFIVMEQSNGGKDLESYTFSSAKQSLSVFKQIAFSLAVAEKSVEFEHRDLHWGNVLVSKTSEKHILYNLNGTQYSVTSNGVKCTIIDYTLSRIKYISQVPIYNDIGRDPEMFIATGDYQFDIYRFMKNDVEDDWSRFAPKTNARWLHYLLDKILTRVKYQRKTAKVHKDSLKVLGEIYKWVEGCGSAFDIALRLAEMKH